MRRFIIITVMLAALFALAACGGNDEEAPAPADSAPAAEAPAPTATPQPATATPLPTETPAPVVEATDSPLPTPDAGRSVEGSPLPTPVPDVDTNVQVNDPLTTLMLAAQQVLAESEDTNAQDFVLSSFEQVEWGDASIGCPEPGNSYAQVVTPGYLFIFVMNDKEYSVHTTLNPEGPVVYCPAE
ncbi:hypothetical protein GC175_07690 [bacterium]|nr:hypothetical protein [bacterium]